MARQGVNTAGPPERRATAVTVLTVGCERTRRTAYAGGPRVGRVVLARSAKAGGGSEIPVRRGRGRSGGSGGVDDPTR